MRKVLVLAMVLAGCSGGAEGEGDNAAAPAKAPKAGLTLVGLYEGGAVERRNQMCVTQGEGGESRFGLVVWGSDMHSCSGTGIATRDGATLRLAMAGDEACTIEAAIDGNAIALPGVIPEGCAYYCGARATLADARFIQTGTTAADAARAKDLVGESLCG